MHIRQYLILFFAVVAYSACTNRSTKTESDQPAVEETPETRLVISISKRQLYVLEGNDTIQRYAVAVGKQGHPTPRGEFEIHQIDWNPDWTPPESEWAQNESYKKPGQAGNPMGRARIIYQMPYTIHGTKDLESLGEAESHGSVRMANTEVINLGKFLMERTGTHRSSEWFDQVLNDFTTMESVKLEKRIRLTNEE